MELAVQQENDAYMIESPWRAAIISYLADRRSMELLTSEEILAKAIQKPMERQTKVDQMQVASILKELGWIKRRESSGKRRWYYQLDDQPRG
jgi:arginine repressor